ncbi:MAG: hypothetical protein LBH79_05000 [Nitrososphaerota archaeon]|jgi:hypothetical protein|nr:hypothetical protein [Nitrososphaerota archaeon]
MTSNDKYVHDKNALIIILVAAALFLMFTIQPYNISWIKLVSIGLIAASVVVWLVSNSSLRRTIKYVLVVVSIFAISFSAVEGYMLHNMGYPPTFDSSQPNDIPFYTDEFNVSLTELVQSAKSTPAFRLLMLEYPGEISIENIVLMDNSVGLSFYFVSANVHVSISSNTFSGKPYQASVSGWGKSSFAQMYPRQQTHAKDLEQIDNLGLQWYYDHAIEAYQNKTGVAPEIDSVSVSIQAHTPPEYQGLQLGIFGSCMHKDNGYKSVFYANFHPNGTIIDIKCFNQ